MGSRPPSRPGGVSNAERATIAAAVSRVLDDTRYRRPAEQLGRSLRHAARWVSQRQYGGSEWLKLIAHTAAVGLSSRLLGHGIVAVVVCGR
jgi:hypothetical protein